MNNIKILRQLLLIGTTIIYFIGHFFIHSTFYYSGIFIIALILISLQTFSFKKIALISSTIITYPAMWIFTFSLPGSLGIKMLFITIFGLTFIATYLSILKNIWSWIDSELILTFIISFSLLAVFSLFFAHQRSLDK